MRDRVLKPKTALFFTGLTIMLFTSWSFVATSCHYTKGPIEPMEILTANSWVLREMNEKEITMRQFEKGAPYLKFQSDGKIKIFTGCDYIDGTFKTSGSLLWLNFDTSQKCHDYLVSDFLYALRSSTNYKTKLERLILIRDKDELMYFFPK